MTGYKHGHRDIFPRRHRRLSSGMEAVDAQWKDYHRFLFRICAERISPSDDLAQFALTVAEQEELDTLVRHLIEQGSRLGLTREAVADLEAPGITPTQIQRVCFRLARHNDSLHAAMVDFLADTARIPDEFPPLPDIAEKIGELFSLATGHIRILAALHALEDIEPLSNMMRQTTHRTQMDIIADAAEMDVTSFVRETAPGSPLERLGLISFRGGRDEVSDINISRPLLFALRSNTLDDLRAGLFDETPPPRFGLSDFSVDADEARTCAAAIRGGHPLLIAGEPGIGKTEFVRTLITSLGRRAHTLATVNRHSEYRGPRGSDSEGGRINAIRMAANLLSPAGDVLVVDEADTILQSAAGFFGFPGGLFGGNYDKAVLNELLEHLPVATVWITNGHRMIPASALRRFGHVFAFPHPSIDTRVRMLSERLGPLADSGGGDSVSAGGDSVSAGGAPSRDAGSWTRDLAARFDITPAAIDRTARIIAAELEAREISPGDVRHRVRGYIEQISTGALAHDVRRLPAVSPSFDPRFCSTTEPLDRIERQALHRAGKGQGLRLLFGGPPGGGKTQYALWLARRLGRDVVLKRPSDLLSKFVGESEQQIAAAFRGAARAGSVLVIDEADALLYDRATAQRSWEHSQIAEFLQQIQEYTGILIACTNRVDAVDPALRRRFHKHVTFGAVSDDVLPAALAHIFPDVTFTPSDLATLRTGPPLMMSDLATAAEMLEIDIAPETDDAPPEAPSPAAVVQEVLSNAGSRDRSRHIGFK